MTLYDAIRKAAAENRLAGLTILRDPDGRGYQVNAPSAYAANAWAVAISTDPVAALMEALNAPPETAAVEAPSTTGVFD